MSCVHPEGKIAYVHIAKTGGTSIESTLKSLGWNGLKRPPFSKIHHVGYHRMKQVFADLQEAVTIVRNPVDRAISAYRHFVFLQTLRAEQNCQKQLRRLSLLKQGFLPWIFTHSHDLKRWQGIHRPQLFFIRDGGRLHSSSVDYSHTRVFDYADRKAFWMYTLGFVPAEPHIHKIQNIKPVELTQSERDEVMKLFKTDYNVWGEQFNWR